MRPKLLSWSGPVVSSLKRIPSCPFMGYPAGKKSLSASKTNFNLDKSHELITKLHTQNPELSLRKLCRWLGVSRSRYYLREKKKELKAAKDSELCVAIEAIVLEFGGYGYRRVVKELVRRSWKVNSKRVLRVMREEGLLCQHKRRLVITTDSDHSNRVFKNLLKVKS